MIHGNRRGTPESRDSLNKSVTPWAWRSSFSSMDGGLPPEAFFRREAGVVARELLGSLLRSTIGGVTTEGVIVETEAYLGPRDPASHAAARIGRTKRNEAMFGPGGQAYVYRIYGIHWCLNVVTGEIGYPAAVLVRALDPVVGLDSMLDRRGGKTPLCSGPGRLAQALGVSGELDGHYLGEKPLELRTGWAVAEEDVGVSGRIGVGQARDWPLRFFVRGHPEVSGKPR
jgi:DNA-3-methyladenine glycosylase